VVLDGEQRAHVALEYEVRLDGSLDGLADLRVGGVNQIPQFATDRLLPVGERVDVVIDRLSDW
jgi:hypothetical protein